MLKGFKGVILGNPPYIQFTTVPFKPLSDKRWMKCLNFTDWKLILFNCGFSIKLSCGFPL